MEWLSAPTYDKNITIDASVITNTSTSTVTNNSHFSFEQLIDDNSIETMNRNSPGKRKQSNRIIQPPLQQQNDDISIISEAQTIATMDTRISVMESSINNMSKLMTMFMSSKAAPPANVLENRSPVAQGSVPPPPPVEEEHT